MAAARAADGNHSKSTDLLLYIDASSIITQCGETCNQNSGSVKVCVCYGGKRQYVGPHIVLVFLETLPSSVGDLGNVACHLPKYFCTVQQ